MSTKSHKRQHFVPKSYLEAWMDTATPDGQDPYVWVFPLTGGLGRRRAPANLFKETDMYTIAAPDGGRDLTIEAGLSQLEGWFASTRKHKFLQRKELTNLEILKVSAFVAAMHGRTQRFRNHQQAQWQTIVDAGDEIMRNMAMKSDSEKRRISSLQLPSSGPTMDMDDVKAIASRPLQYMLPITLDIELKYLWQMDHNVLVAPAGSAFITSDNPVSWTSESAAQNPVMFRSPSFSDPDLEIAMPLSPSQMLVLRHSTPMGGGYKPVAYQDVSASIVEFLNRRVARHSDTEIVANSENGRVAWFVSRT